MRTKVLIVVVALVLGGLAAVVAANYLRGARESIVSEGESVTVLVAQEDLPRGLTANELVERELVAEEEVPRTYVAADAISSPRAVENEILAVPVSKGEQLTASRFEFPAQAGLGYSVPEGQVAIAIEVDEISGVAGLLKPGDDVVVFATYEPQGDVQQAITMTEVGKGRVLAVGSTISQELATASTSEEEAGGGGALSGSQTRTEGVYQTVTLALPIVEAQNVVFAHEEGSIHLALLARNSEEPALPLPSWLGELDYDRYSPVLPLGD